MFTAGWSEAKVSNLFKVAVQWLFTMDRKETAINFMMDNFQEQAEHHYMDANDFLAEAAGKCYWHKGRTCPLNREK